MALIDCPECGREVSSSASVCPACAYPIGTGSPRVSARGVSQPPDPRWWKIAIPILGRLSVAAILAIGAVDEQSVAGLIGSILIGASAIPAWYRWKIERLRLGPSGAAPAEGLEDRILEMEHRHREQIVQLEQGHAGQIAELEERMDFTERLLTKREKIGPG